MYMIIMNHRETKHLCYTHVICLTHLEAQCNACRWNARNISCGNYIHSVLAWYKHESSILVVDNNECSEHQHGQ